MSAASAADGSAADGGAGERIRKPKAFTVLDVGAALEGDELVLADAPVPVGVNELEQPAHLVLQ